MTTIKRPKGLKETAQSLYYKCREMGMNHAEALNAVVLLCVTGEIPVFKVSALPHKEGHYTIKR